MPICFADEQDVRDSAIGRFGSKNLELSSNSPSSSAEYTYAFWYSLLSSKTLGLYLEDLVSTMMLCSQFFSLLLCGVLCSKTQTSTVETTNDARSYAAAAAHVWTETLKLSFWTNEGSYQFHLWTTWRIASHFNICCLYFCTGF